MHRQWMILFVADISKITDYIFHETLRASSLNPTFLYYIFYTEIMFRRQIRNLYCTVSKYLQILSYFRKKK
jgi:hypothetical protein